MVKAQKALVGLKELIGVGAERLFHLLVRLFLGSSTVERLKAQWTKAKAVLVGLKKLFVEGAHWLCRFDDRLRRVAKALFQRSKLGQPFGQRHLDDAEVARVGNEALCGVRKSLLVDEARLSLE